MNNKHTSNSKNLYISSFWFSIKDIIIGSFLSVYLLRLNAANWEMSLYEAIQGGLGVVVLLFFSVYLDNSRKTFLRYIGIDRFGFLLFALSLLFIKNPLIIVLLYGIYYAAFTVAGPVAPNYVKEAIPKEKWGSVFSTNKIVLVATNMVTLFAAGKLLDYFNYKFPYNFIIMFLISGVSYCTAFFFLRNIKAEIKDIKSNAGRLELLRHVDKNMMLMLLVYIPIYMLAPLWAIYHVRDLGLSNFQVALLPTVYYLGGILVMPLWGRLLQKVPIKKLFVVSSILMALIPFFYMISANFYFVLFAQFVFGLAANGFDVVIQNNLMESSQNMKYDYAYMSNFQIYTGLIKMIFPALGILLYTNVGMVAAFLIIGALRAAAGVITWYGLRDDMRDVYETEVDV